MNRHHSKDEQTFVQNGFSDERETVPLQRLTRKPAPHYTKLLLPGLSGASGVLLGCALPSLIGVDGLLDIGKCVVLATAGTGVSYGINRLALERGALQAAIGSKTALLASTASILLVGGGLFSGTYSGLVLEDTDRLHLSAHGQEQTAVIATRTDTARRASRIGPAVQSLSEELEAIAACESASSCFSDNGNGGEGPTFHALSNAHNRAKVVVGQVQLGAEAVQKTLIELNSLQDRYNAVVADGNLSADERRTEAQILSSRIGQKLGEMDEATPTTLVAAYADELGTGNIPASATQSAGRLNGLFVARAGQLKNVIATVPRAQAPLPAFPPPAGVADTLTKIRHFLPIALIVGVVELVFPITLWLYTFVALRARLDQDDPRGVPVGSVAEVGASPDLSSGERKQRARPGRPAKKNIQQGRKSDAD